MYGKNMEIVSKFIRTIKEIPWQKIDFRNMFRKLNT